MATPSSTDVKSIPLKFYISTSAAPWDIPQVAAGDVAGAQMLTPEQAVQRLKDFKPYQYEKNIGSNIQIAYPGIQQGESVFDWMQRVGEVKDPGNKAGGHGAGLGQLQDLLKNPNAVSQDVFDVGGKVMTKEAAFATPEQKAYDLELLKKIQAEKTAAQTLVNQGMPKSTPAAAAPAPANIPFQGNLTDIQKQSIENLVASGRAFNETDAKNYAFATGQTDFTQFVGKTPQDLGFPTKALPAINFKPTDYSSTAGLTDLQSTVMNTQGTLKANDAFINGVFKAFHNRDATAQELEAYRGKPVNEVRVSVIGGAQAAGLPTVAAGTVDIPTGILTPEQAEANGYQRVLRPDQLSAFSEDQIIRDNRGGIYMNPDTTTQAQRDAVESGKTGSQISKSPAPISGNTAKADEIEKVMAAPDPVAFAEMFLSGPSDDATAQKTALVSTASDYLSTILASYSTLIADIDARQLKAEQALTGLTGRLEGLTTSTAATDALNKEKEGLLKKQALFSEIQQDIANVRAQMNLGLAREKDKLAPMSILGRRQASLEAQGLAQIGALTSIAQILQNDLEFAKDMAVATVQAINQDREVQINALGTLVELNQKEIVRLSDEEANVIKNRQEALTKQMDQTQKNADKVFDLIKDNPEAALKGKVTYNDSPAMVLAKMVPYMTEEKELNTQVVDLGTQKALINLDTGEVIETFAEVEGDKTSGAGGGTDTSGGASVASFAYTDAKGRPLKLTATQVDALSSFDTTLDQISDAVSLMTQVDVGPISGRLSRIGRQFGFDDPERIRLDSILSSIKANFMKALSGAAVSEPEVKRLSRFLPEITDTEQTMAVKMQELQNAIQIQKTNLLNILGGTEGSSEIVEGTSNYLDSLGIND